MSLGPFVTLVPSLFICPFASVHLVVSGLGHLHSCFVFPVKPLLDGKGKGITADSEATQVWITVGPNLNPKQTALEYAVRIIHYPSFPNLASPSGMFLLVASGIALVSEFRIAVSSALSLTCLGGGLHLRCLHL